MANKTKINRIKLLDKITICQKQGHFHIKNKNLLKNHKIKIPKKDNNKKKIKALLINIIIKIFKNNN